MKVGSLFSGIGGFDLGLERAGFDIAWQVERDDYCREVLKKHWPAVPCHYDITSINWQWIPRVDLVCGGFPCQPFSCAGKRQGKDDDRYLWPEVVRCLAVLRPTWFIGENVPGLLHLGIEQVLTDLEALGYQTAVLGIPACGVDAPHIRQRLWFLAHAESDLRRASRHDGPETSYGRDSSLADAERSWWRETSASVDAEGESFRQAQRPEGASLTGPSCEDLAYANCSGQSDAQGRDEKPKRDRRRAVSHSSRWDTEPAVGRVADGVPHRVDRLKALGNAIVPQIAEAIGTMILDVERGMRRR